MLAHSQRSPRTGFTLIEALLALTLTALAGSVLLLGTHGTLHVTDSNIDQTLARGIARQLMDEILNQRYMEEGESPYSLTLGPSEWELAGAGRSRFNDIDDYNGYTARPLEDLWGRPLGQEDDQGGLRSVKFRVRPNQFRSWSVRVRVFYVDATDHSKELRSGASDFRGIEIRVHRHLAPGDAKQLAYLRRVVGYVP